MLAGGDLQQARYAVKVKGPARSLGLRENDARVETHSCAVSKFDDFLKH